MFGKVKKAVNRVSSELLSGAGFNEPRLDVCFLCNRAKQFVRYVYDEDDNVIGYVCEECDR